jgi:hypothetical protein
MYTLPFTRTVAKHTDYCRTQARLIHNFCDYIWKPQKVNAGAPGASFNARVASTQTKKGVITQSRESQDILIWCKYVDPILETVLH